MTYLAISDIHNDYKSLLAAYNKSIELRAKLIFLGDIVDYGPDPANTILFAAHLAETEKAMFVEGNHDNKIFRWISGNDVKIYPPAMDTTIKALEDIQVKDAFGRLYANMVPYVEIEDTVFTHGAVMPEFWRGEKDTKKTQRGFMYGEINPDRSKKIMMRGQEYPSRLYDWTLEIPGNKTVVVGHDRSPFETAPAFDKNITKVSVSKNMQGGTVVFTDTGGGKGGFVSGVVLDNQVKYQKSISFK